MSRSPLAVTLTLLSGLLAVAARPLPLLAQTGAADPEADAVRYASVRSLDGELDLERIDPDNDDGTGAAVAGGPASRNQPLIAGDRLTTSDSGRAEIVLPDGSLLWLDRDTRVTLLGFSPNTLLRLSRGALALSASGTQAGGGTLSGAAARVDFRGGTLLALDRGRYRVSLEHDGLGFVRVESGLAELSGRRGSVLVRAGERSSVYPGEEPETAYAYNTAVSDDFQRWIDDRERESAATLTLSYQDEEQDLPPALQPYRYELATHGTWRYYTPFQRYVWFPGVAVSWRPWVNGYWTWYPQGLTWISAEPWGYATYHYGSWDRADGYGWFWVPGRHYAPAWVDWYVYDDYVAWCPRRSYSYWNHRGHHRHYGGHHGEDGHHDGHGDGAHGGKNKHDAQPERSPYVMDWNRTVAVKRDSLVGRPVRDAVVPSEKVRNATPRLRRDRLERIDVGVHPVHPVKPVPPAKPTVQPMTPHVPDRPTGQIPDRPVVVPTSTPVVRGIADRDRGTGARAYPRDIRGSRGDEDIWGRRDDRDRRDRGENLQPGTPIARRTPATSIEAPDARPGRYTRTPMNERSPLTPRTVTTSRSPAPARELERERVIDRRDRVSDRDLERDSYDRDRRQNEAEKPRMSPRGSDVNDSQPRQRNNPSLRDSVRGRLEPATARRSEPRDHAQPREQQVTRERNEIREQPVARERNETRQQPVARERNETREQPMTRERSEPRGRAPRSESSPPPPSPRVTHAPPAKPAASASPDRSKQKDSSGGDSQKSRRKDR